MVYSFFQQYVTVKTKSPTSEERWEGPGFINVGAAYPLRLAFWGEGNVPCDKWY